MKAQAKKVQAMPVNEDAVYNEATEYLAMKAELERIGLIVAKKKKFLKEALESFPGKQVEVGEEILYLCEISDSESFDLEKAEELLSEASREKLIEPFVVTERSLDLQFAKKKLGVDIKKIEKFIKVTPNTSQLRTKEKKEKVE